MLLIKKMKIVNPLNFSDVIRYYTCILRIFFFGAEYCLAFIGFENRFISGQSSDKEIFNNIEIINIFIK